MWGTGASSTQSEGAEPHSDWIDSERAGKPVASIFGLSTLEIHDGEPSMHEFATRFYNANWNAGLGLVLDRLRNELPNTPLLIAEFGVGTSDDALRAEYLRAGLNIAHDAIQRGIDIRGFFQWTAFDNYEWLHGFDLQFGIINIDRTIKPSAKLLQREAQHPLGTVTS